MTELEVVNDILRAAGDSPVNSINSTHPAVTAIRTQVNRTVQKLQRRGFWFNTEHGHEFQPANNRITLPNDVSSIVPEDPNVVMRGTALYDRKRNTYSFEVPVKVISLIRVLEFDQLPEAMKEAVKYAAAVEYVRDTLGDQQLIADLKVLAQDSMLAVLNDNLEAEQLNAFNRPAARRMKAGVFPSWRNY
jgi:hypothetical protein